MRLFFAVMVLFCCVTIGCAAGISRTGYDVSKLNYDDVDQNCKVAIKYKFDSTDYDVEILGEIKSYDKGVSMECSEATVFTLFLKDACALGAHLINVIEEEQPDPWVSSCYRAKAQLIRFNKPDIAASMDTDLCYSPRSIQHRSLKTHEINRRAIGAGVAGGFMGGMMVR